MAYIPSTPRSLQRKTRYPTIAYPQNKQFSNLPPKVFGCTAFVHAHNINRGKLDQRAIKIGLGYSSTKKSYKFYDPTSRKYHISVDVTFFENQHFTPILHLRGRQNYDAQFWDSGQNHTSPPQILNPTDPNPNPTRRPSSRTYSY